MTKVSKLAQSAAPENLAELQKSGLEAVTTLNTAMAENVSRFYGEWMQFLSHRLRENVRVQQKILTCGSLEEARALQARIVEEQVRSPSHHEAGHLAVTQTQGKRQLRLDLPGCRSA